MDKTYMYLADTTWLIECDNAVLEQAANKLTRRIMLDDILIYGNQMYVTTTLGSLSTAWDAFSINALRTVLDQLHNRELQYDADYWSDWEIAGNLHTPPPNVLSGVTLKKGVYFQLLDANYKIFNGDYSEYGHVRVTGKDILAYEDLVTE